MDNSSAANTALPENRLEGRPLSWWPCIEVGLISHYLTGLAVLLGVFLGLDLFEGPGRRFSPQRIPPSSDRFLDVYRALATRAGKEVTGDY